MMEDRKYAVAGDTGGQARSSVYFEMADAVREWRGRMKHVEHDLEMITNHTEEEFLSIGSVLRGFYNRARKVSELSSTVAARMTGAEIVEAIDDLNGLLERMEGYLQHSEAETKKRIGNLHGILNAMGGMYDPLEDFQRITKTLRSLNITARVQNASLMTRNGELDVLLGEVRTLSEIMTAKLEAIRKNLRSLENSMKQTLAQLLFFEDKQQGKARAVLDSTMSVICSITEQYGLSATVAQDIADHFSEISRSIGEIVTSVQFHDITRQHFERVKKAVNYVHENLCHLPEKHFFASDPERMTWMAAEIEHSCRQHVSELFSVRDTFVTAVRGITDHLKRIAEKVTALSGDTRKIVGHEGTTTRTFLAVTEGILSSVTASFAAISESAAADSELSDAVRSLTGSTAEVAEFIGDIEGIAEDIELIAFNTEIKSSHMGKEGATFEIVAAGIRKLSADTCTWAGRVSEILRFIASAAGELASGSPAETGSPLGEVAAISGDLERLISSLSGLNKNIVSLFADIDGAGRALSGDIESIARSINVHTAVDRAVNKVAVELNETASHAHLMVPTVERGGSRRIGQESEWLRAALNSAVMAAEGRDGDGVELF